jgi:hypothetical protein
MIGKAVHFAAALGLLAGCGGRYANPQLTASDFVTVAPSASAPPAARAPGEADPDAAPGDPAITIVTTGAEPRAPLRYRLASGTQQSAEIALQTVLTQGANTMNLPTVTIGVNLGVAEVLGNGRYRADYHFNKFDVTGGPPGAGKAAQELFKGMGELKGHAVFTERGFVRDFSIELPADASAQLKEMADEIRQSMTESAAIFPSPPLGQGAEWTVTKTITKRGMTVEQTGRYTLAAREADRCTVDVVITQTAAPQPMTLPGLPPGAVAELSTLTSDGRGSSDFDLTKPFPKTGSMKTKMEMGLTVTMKDQKQPVTMKLDVDMKLSSK